MKAEQLYQHLKDLAEKLGITVNEHSFRNAGVKVKSGFCKVKEKDVFIMDRNLPLNRKTGVLAEFLGQMPCDTVYVIPAVRDFIKKHTRPAFVKKD